MSIVEQLLRWIVHAAIFRAMWSLSLAVVAVVGVLALVLWIWRRRVHSHRRHDS